MTQSEKLLFLIHYLINENSQYGNIGIPGDEAEYFNLYRSLVNVRMPAPVSEEYLQIEDEFLREETVKKGITTHSSLDFRNGIAVWQGDITTLECDAIVNAANSQMLGCFVPCHRCIDNCIHTFAGIRLRTECEKIMKEQNSPEPTGRAKITPAFNLPCRFVIHTVGPIVTGGVTDEHKSLLASCYEECLKLADEKGLESIAFCCISTGEFRFPNELAAEIAVNTVVNYKKKTGSEIKVIFNVFKDRDRDIYERLLSDN